jgi:hypothetical protein
MCACNSTPFLSKAPDRLHPPGAALQAPGTGFTAGACVPPNNYSFYCEDERYKPVKSPDGRFFSGTAICST